jgi:hypothetical protein
MIVLKVSSTTAFAFLPVAPFFMILGRAPGKKDGLKYGFNFIRVKA